MPNHGRIPLIVGTFIAFSLAPAVVRAQSHARVAVPDSSVVTPHMVEEGREIFHGQGTCFACHGDHLQGGPIAPPLTQHKWKDATGGSFGAILQVVRTGVSGTAMVSHPGGISDEQTVEVAAYIWAVTRGRAKP